MRALFHEVIREAKSGKVLIDNEEWGIAFNTFIYDNGITKIEYFNDKNLSTLVIKDEDEFMEALEEYIFYVMNSSRKISTFRNDEYYNKIKTIISYLFINFSTEDFLNPVVAIRRNIDYIHDDTFEELDGSFDIPLDCTLDASNIYLKRSLQSVMMETPYKMEIGLSKLLENQVVTCPLADISYGIREENGEKVCYVYSMMKPKKRCESSDAEKLFGKKINRELYKLNAGVLKQESDSFDQDEDRCYQENVTDVTQSFVLALSIFVFMLQKEGISKIKVVPYLPVRYLGRQVAALNISDPVKQEELLERNRRIQDNCTNKFMRTFRRVAYHMGNDLELYSVPYDIDEYMTFELNSKSCSLNNPILEDVSNAVLSSTLSKR